MEILMNFRSALLASVAMALSTGAFAADLPTRKEAPPPLPVVAPWTWSGFYVGAYAGGSFGSASFSDPIYFGSSSSPAGFTIGGLAGFNYQMGAVVLGAEAEYGYDGQGSSGQNFAGRIGRNAYNLTEKLDETGVGRVRARLGYAIQSNVLLYAAGGWTFVNTDSSLSGACCGSANAFSVSNNKSVNGWNLGVGGEYAFTPNWIGRLEYIYDGFYGTNFHYSYAPAAFVDNRSLSLSENTIHAGLEYKF
jgi:outer membrane immunogenic protein